MGKKGKNRNGQNVRIIRVKKQKQGYEPPGRSHSTSSEEQQKESADLFHGYGVVDLSEKENTNPAARKTDDSRASAVNRKTPASASAAVAPIIRPKGLTNLGNTCYFNSVLQALSQTRLLRELLAQISADGCEWEAIHVRNIHPNIRLKEQQPVKKEPDAQNHDHDDEDDGIEKSISSSISHTHENLILSLPPAFEIFNCFTDTLREIRSPSGSTVFTPNRLLNSLGRKSCQFRGREQQDSHELLRTLLDMIRTDEVRRKRKSVLTSLGISDVKNVDDDTKAIVKSYAASCNFSTIDSLFGGYILSTVRCEVCDSTSQIFEQFYDLSLPISEGHPLPHAHQHQAAAAGSSSNSKNNAGNQQNSGNNRRGWEKKNKSTSNTAAIPLPAPGENATTTTTSQVKDKSQSDHKDGKSIPVPSSGTAFKVNNSSSVKSRKQMRAEKKAVRRAVKQEKKKQEKNQHAAASVKDDADATDEQPGDEFPAEDQSKDVTDTALQHTDTKEQEDGILRLKAETLAGHDSDMNDSDFDMGEMVPLFSDLAISQGNRSDREKDNGNNRNADASPATALTEATAAGTAAASASSLSSSLSSGRRDASEGCDNSNLRIDMSYSMDASHKNLDVRLQIETSNECNVNLAINHKTASGSRSTSFECCLKAEAADQESAAAGREAKNDAQVAHEQQRGTGEDDPSCLLDPAVSEVASENDDEEDKDDRISSLSGGRGDEEDEGVDADSDAASSTRAMIDDQDLDDQMLAIDESLDYWGENMIEEFTVRGDGNEPFEDLEPPDVIDDLHDQSHHSVLLTQLPGQVHHPLHQELPAAATELIPADSTDAATLTTTVSEAIAAQAIIPPEGAQNDMKPITESSSPATTDEAIRRIRFTSESAAAVKRKVNWTLKTAGPAFVVSDSHQETPSIESCLSVFTLPELLTGSNKLSCENCSSNRQKESGSSSGAPASPGAKECKVFSNASKQMLIAYPPIILTLHLKRFYAEGYGQMHLRKINRHVRFPFILNMAPWVSQMYKRMGQEMGVNEDANGTTLSYKLYGLVEHSGTLRSGHYTAMIRVSRRKQSSSPSSQDDDSKAMRAKYLRMKPFISSVESFLDSLHDLDHRNPPEEETAEEKPLLHVNNNNDTDNDGVCSTSSNQHQVHLLSDDQKRLQSEGIDTSTCVNNNGNNDNSCKSNQSAIRKGEKNKKRETLEQNDEDDDENDKWFYVSDSHVAPTTRESVLNAQAYILFYERI